MSVVPTVSSLCVTVAFEVFSCLVGKSVDGDTRFVIKKPQFCLSVNFLNFSRTPAKSNGLDINVRANPDERP